MLLQAAINGARRPAEHPALPVQPDELAAAAKACVAGGAGAIHFHVRAPDGRESLAAPDVARAVGAVRGACRGTPVGISTGAWIEPDPDRRLALVRRWHTVPDFASVNFHETGSPALARLLIERGIGVEAGLVDRHAADVFAASGLAGRCLRVMFEPQEDDLVASLRNVDEMERVVDRAGIDRPRLLHGLGPTAWGLIDEAARRGYDTRAGLEDMLTLPDGSPAPDNAAIVAEAKRRIESLVVSR
jgi:uncharacterized protein (DUF849 family)